MHTVEQIEKRPIVVCLHSSASTGGQWRALRRALRGRCRVFTPDLIGYGSRAFRPGANFSLQDEVDAIIEQIGDITEPFHLVGHSYGGSVATYFAKHYPARVRSLILYEPANFPMLFAEGLETPAAIEIRRLRAAFGRDAATPFARWRAARQFISYWSGVNTWQRLGFAERGRFARLMPKVAAEFDALQAAANTLTDLDSLDMPVRLISGTRTRPAAKRVCSLMAKQLQNCRHLQLVNLAHMAPVTDPGAVNPMLIAYLLPPPVSMAHSGALRCAQ